MAIHDYMTRPKVLGVTFEPGDPPQVGIFGGPAWKIVRGEVEIRNAQGTVLEWGPAEKKDYWRYKVTEPPPEDTPVVVVVTVADRLGKKTIVRYASPFLKKLKLVPPD